MLFCQFWMESTRLAPGFRFHPTDVELIMYYLKRKVLGKKLCIQAISELNIYKFDPWDLPEKSCIKSEDRQWYFFCPTERKYASGGRMNRSAETGYWKGTGKDRSIPYKDRVVGMVKTLIFHRGHPPKGERTDWVMHEYRMQDQELTDAGVPQDAFVVCKLFHKDGPGARKSAQYGATFKEEEWDDETSQCDETLATASLSVATAGGTQLLATSSTSELTTMGGPEVLSVCPLDEQDPPSLHGDSMGISSMEDVDFQSLWDSFAEEDIPPGQYYGPVNGDAFSENDLFSGLPDSCNWPAFDGSSFSFSEMQPFQDSYLELDDLNNCDPNFYLELNDQNNSDLLLSCNDFPDFWGSSHQSSGSTQVCLQPTGPNQNSYSQAAGTNCTGMFSEQRQHRSCKHCNGSSSETCPNPPDYFRTS